MGVFWGRGTTRPRLVLAFPWSELRDSSPFLPLHWQFLNFPKSRVPHVQNQEAPVRAAVRLGKGSVQLEQQWRGFSACRA